MLQPQVFYVYVELTQVAKESSKLPGSVIDHHDELLKPARLPVFAGKPLHAFVASANSLGNHTTSTGGIGVTQSVGDRCQLASEIIQNADDSLTVRAQNLYPQLGRRGS